MSIAKPHLTVLVALHSGSYSGVDTYAEQVAAAGAAASHAVTLVAAGEDVAADVRRRMSDIDLRVAATRTLPRSGLRSIARQVPTLALAELQSRLHMTLNELGEWFDVAHLNHPALAEAVRPFVHRIVVGAWFYPHSARGRMVETWRHTGQTFPRSAGFALKGLSHYWNDRRGFSASDCIVAPTELLAGQLQSLGLQAVVCPPPTHRRRMQTPSRRANGHGAERKRRVTICCGDLSHPRKNVRTGIDAVRRLAAAGLVVDLELIGRKAEYLSDALNSLPHSVEVITPGSLPRDQTQARLRDSDVLLVPSLYEEWGYVVTEALLVGTPVVACPVYPFIEILGPPLGECAKESSAGALAETLAHVLVAGTDRRHVAALAAQRFGAEAVGLRLTGIWSSACSEANGPADAPLRRS